MTMFLIVLFLSLLQWLSIWVGIMRIDKNRPDRRKDCFHVTFCAMGLPSIFALPVALIIAFTAIPDWVSLVVFILASYIFAFNGKKLSKELFPKKKENKKKNCR